MDEATKIKMGIIAEAEEEARLEAARIEQEQAAA